MKKVVFLYFFIVLVVACGFGADELMKYKYPYKVFKPESLNIAKEQKEKMHSSSYTKIVKIKDKQIAAQIRENLRINEDIQKFSLHTLSRVSSVYISKESTSLEGLQHCVNLAVVSIDATGEKRKNLKVLSKLKHLEAVFIDGSNFKNFKNLNSADNIGNIRFNGLSKKQLNIIKEFKNVKYVSITNSNFDKKNLGELREVKSLSLFNVGVVDIGYILPLTELKYLTIRDSDVKNKNRISEFKELETLHLDEK